VRFLGVFQLIEANKVKYDPILCTNYIKIVLKMMSIYVKGKSEFQLE